MEEKREEPTAVDRILGLKVFSLQDDALLSRSFDL
jgi:hypothetical protein